METDFTNIWETQFTNIWETQFTNIQETEFTNIQETDFTNIWEMFIKKQVPFYLGKITDIFFKSVLLTECFN